MSKKDCVVWEQLEDFVGSGLQLAQVCAWGVGEPGDITKPP